MKAAEAAPMLFELDVPQPYDFAASVREHGWVALAPWQWDAERSALQRVELLDAARVVLLDVAVAHQDGRTVLPVRVCGADALSAPDRAELARRLRWMLRLDEDLTEFHRLCTQQPGWREQAMQGRGRLLRSATLFEDVVKTICTTNTTWRQTMGMVARLVDALGAPLPQAPERRAFPTPAALAAADPALLQERCRLGYRGAYIAQLAHEIVSGEQDLEALAQATLSTEELKRRLKSIKGVGDYAAHTLLMLLGHYDELAIDSVLRGFVARKYFAGRVPTDGEIQALYAPWGHWKYLAYWLELAA